MKLCKGLFQKIRDGPLVGTGIALFGGIWRWSLVSDFAKTA